MGFRFRKSINFGGFRINLSKTGIGYSFGGPGFRWTKLANGRTRTTASIPGTGISYVQETSRCKPKHKQVLPQLVPGQYLSKTTKLCPENYVQTDAILFLKALKRYKYTQMFLQVAIVLSVVSYLKFELFSIIFTSTFALASLYMFFFKRIKVEFICDKYYTDKQNKIDLLLETLSQSCKLFEVRETYTNNNTKYTGGAGNSVKESKLSIIKKSVPFMKTQTKHFCIYLNGKQLVFLPNGILVNSLFNLYLLSMKDLNIHLEDTVYIEFGTPKDSECVRNTWLYVNKHGGPDRRFNNNPMLNGNKYGVIQFFIPDVLDLIVLFSNYKIVPELENIAKELKQMHNNK